MGIGEIKIRSEYQKVRIVVAFGDISGFSDFCDAITNDEAEYDPVMRLFDKLVADAERKTGYSFTDTGDGFMCTHDLSSGHACRIAIKMVLDLWDLYQRIEAMFNAHRQNSICPEGFRIVFAAGYVKRKVKRDGKTLLRGKSINQAHNYLDAARGHGMVCHETFKILMTEEQASKAGIRFTPVRGIRKLFKIHVTDKS